MNLNAWVPWLRKSVVYSLSLNGLWKLTGTFKTQRESEWNVTSQSCMHMNASTYEHTHLHVIDSVIQLRWGNKRKAGKMLLFPKTRKIYDKYEIKLLLCILVFQKCHISGTNVLCSSHNVMQTLKKKGYYCRMDKLKTILQTCSS